MNVALWVLQLVLALVFAMASLMKLSRPRLVLAGQGQAWVQDFSDLQVKGIGVMEAMAVVGLLLPPIIHSATFLTPLAAIGLMLLMVGAGATHLRRGELPNFAGNVVLFLLTSMVAWGRFGPYSF